jgi:hypothetical protein
MWQFINGSDASFADLERQARDARVRFRCQEMPAGTTPKKASIAFLVESESGCAILLVERAADYQGASPEIGDWLSTGEKRFANFADLKNWIRGHLRQYYKTDEFSHQHLARVLRVPAIRTALRDPHQALNLNQQELEALLIAVLSLTPPSDRPS